MMRERLLRFEKHAGQVLLGSALVTFLLSLAAIGFNWIWPGVLADRFVPNSLLSAIIPGIVVLLLYELYMLVRSTRGSFIGFIHYQFEIISLIILRDLFKQLDRLSHAATPQLLRELTVVAVGSIVLYFFVEVLERIRHNLSFAAYEERQQRKHDWVRRAKYVLQGGLAVYFFGLVIHELYRWLEGTLPYAFGTEFLTLVFGGLITYNVIMLFIVLLVSSSYETLFEHSALVLASSVVLISLPRDPTVSVPLIAGALLFVIATLLLHGFARGASLRSLMQVAAPPKQTHKS